MYDIAVMNGIVIDPKNRRLTAANVYCRDGKIAEISREIRESAKVINAGGRYVSPGFIDIHAHIEGKKRCGALLCQQGVTTAVNGNCGNGLDDYPGFFRAMDKSGFIINQVELSGASTLRQKAGQLDRYAPMTAAQIDIANGLLQEELQAGTAGLSFGLEYMPGTDREELYTLSRTAARYGKPVTVHIRCDLSPGLDALVEVIELSRFTGAGVQVSHAAYQFGFGMMRQALDIIDNAVSEGLDVSCDSGMYTSFGTRIGSAVFDDGCLENWHCSYDAIVMPAGKYAGQRLDRESFEDLRKNFPHDTAIVLIGAPAEIPMAFELPYMMVGSDAGGDASDTLGAVHPQDAATFPRFIRQMVVEQKKLTLIDAVSRMTILPAQRMGLSKKGCLSPGNDADITVFDLAAIRDNAVFPHQGRMDALPDGICAVVVNGKAVIEDKRIINDTAGKICYSPNNTCYRSSSFL
ncbi:N-acyl-D-amino-acid deacylase [Spirochaetia bacterium]|nr:N-acyl-D-amino-acid deacylase [Spirochaetia bacterium]